MTILGLEAPAQIIVMQSLSTYAALASAYFFARPVLRGQALSQTKHVISMLEATDTDVTKLLVDAEHIVDQRMVAEHKSARRDNWIGSMLLAVSVLAITGAVGLQVATDAAFHDASAVKARSCPDVRNPAGTAGAHAASC